MSTLDSSWVISAGSNGLAAHNSPQWMALYLAVCKLLDLALALPATFLPQFQMYRWAFVSESGNSALEDRIDSDDEIDVKSEDGVELDAKSLVNGHQGGSATVAGQMQQQDFVPYVVRVAKLLLHKVKLKYSGLRI